MMQIRSILGMSIVRPPAYRTAAGSVKFSWPVWFKLYLISRLFDKAQPVSRTAWRSRAIAAPRLQNRCHFCKGFERVPSPISGCLVKFLSVLDIDKIGMWLVTKNAKSRRMREADVGKDLRTAKAAMGNFGCVGAQAETT